MRTFFVFLLNLTFISLLAQSDGPVKDSPTSNWPEDCREVVIISSVDQARQPAYFRTAAGLEARPLIVSLHSWSGDYTQKDTLSWMAAANNYNYIHPDFRGKNDRPEACGSELAIQDIEDAIGFAIREGQVDTSEIHVIGVSGGGYATLLTYLRSRYPVKTFSAWVPISNLVDWYYESVGRKQKYARDMAQVTHPDQAGPSNYTLDPEEARRRSPVFMATPVDRRESSKLYLYAGIHDGYTGSVPITQSLRFFNKVVRDLDPDNTDDLISTEEMLRLLERRNSQIDHPSKVATGDTHFRRQHRGRVQVTIFEGGHQMLPDRLLEPLRGERILAIGDSNGALENGWVNQLKGLRFRDHFYNTSVSGNTIGFDNLGRESLNTLKNVDRYLREADRSLGGIDRIVIMLGTNDCKAVFDDSLGIVPENFQALIQSLKAHPVYMRDQPAIYVVSPPPYAPDAELISKYHGGEADIEWLFPRFREVAEHTGCTFIDTYSSLSVRWSGLSEDGIHLTTEGQKWIAKVIVAAWEENGVK